MARAAGRDAAVPDVRAAVIVRWLPPHRAWVFVAEHHRHLGGEDTAAKRQKRIAVLALGAYVDDVLVGVAILGRPVARLGDTGERLDVIRLATNGVRNAGSALYSRARRVSQVLGLLPPRTHTLDEESGASLRGAGYVEDGRTDGGDWDREGRERAASPIAGPKRRWRA